jgi:hypothetical protein
MVTVFFFLTLLIFPASSLPFYTMSSISSIAVDIYSTSYNPSESFLVRCTAMLLMSHID